MTHNQNITTTTVQVQMTGRTILDSNMHKLPSTRKCYRVTLIVPDNGIPMIEYHQISSFKKPRKSIQFVDLLFADKKYDTNEKNAFSVYTTEKTITFIAPDETTMNEWLSKIRERHSQLYPEFKRYDAIFEGNLQDKGLAKAMNIRGTYRIALCKESLDLIPLVTAASGQLLDDPLQQLPQSTKTSSTTSSSNSTTISNHHEELHNKSKSQHLDETHHHLIDHVHHNTTHITSPLNLNSSTTIMKTHPNHLYRAPQHIPSHRRFHKRHPNLSVRIIELVLRSIRRCGHTDCNFYIESGRHSQIGEGDLWLTLNKKSTARYLHELLRATMRQATTNEEFLCKAPRSRSGSSSDGALRSQQSRSSSLVCLASEQEIESKLASIDPMNDSQQQKMTSMQITAATLLDHVKIIPMVTNNALHNSIDEDSGYLPMA